jgi:transcriptional regulator with XRE-family HTH domain
MTTAKATRFRAVLRAYCDAKRGRQAELARHLGVNRQQVRDWLSGTRQPAHEATIAILRWLPLAERRAILAAAPPHRP